MSYHENHRVLFSCCMFVLVTIMHMLSHGCVEGRSRPVVQKHVDLKHKGTVKTIESEDGDVIDCVDIYKQPAFDHPLINDLQMEPSSYPGGMKMDHASQPELIQDWHKKNGGCPEGTIPIRRTPNHVLHRTKFPFDFHRRKQLNLSSKIPPNGHEYAQVYIKDGLYHGAHASINVWNPKIEDPTEFSISQIWIVSNEGDEINTIEVGWTVFPARYGDYQTRFFIFWTSDNYQSKRCYDLECSGFVQINHKFALGSPIKPVSTYNGVSFDITIDIFKDKITGSWWLQLQDMVLGYWPDSIFTGLADSATAVSWGGEIINSRSKGRHTTTQMGSGHFSSEGKLKASYFRNLGVIDSSNNRIDPAGSLQQDATTYPSCYDVTLKENSHTIYGTYFYYGGPGYSDKCP